MEFDRDWHSHGVDDALELRLDLVGRALVPRQQRVEPIQ